MLCISDANGILLMASRPLPGNRHDSADFEENMAQVASMAEEMGISLDGLFLNADAGFDHAEVRRVLNIHQIEAKTSHRTREMGMRIWSVMTILTKSYIKLDL
ncbi:MAG: hypothetical protein ACI81T_003448 [Bacteroidia bacterium]|jgi:hypothetical protein